MFLLSENSIKNPKGCDDPQPRLSSLMFSIKWHIGTCSVGHFGNIEVTGPIIHDKCCCQYYIGLYRQYLKLLNVMTWNLAIFPYKLLVHSLVDDFDAW